MKKMKRLLALVLAFCMTFSLAVTTASAAEGDEGEPVELVLNWNEEYTAATAEVTVPAGGVKYCSSYMLGGMVITIEHEQAYVIYDGETYRPVNGVVTVAIPSAMGRVYTELAIGNTGGGENAYTLKIAPPLGTSSNPQILTDSELGYFSADLAENDENGYDFQWTATSSGYLYVGATGSNGDCDVSLYNKNTYAMRQMWTTDSNDESICSNPAVIWVNEGDVVGINLTAKGDSSFYYPAMTVEAVGGVAAGTSAAPIPVSSPTFIAEVGAGQTVYYSGYSVGMTLVITGSDLANVSVVCGRGTYTDDDGDGVIYAEVTRSLGSFGGGGTTVSVTNGGEANGYYTISIPVGAETNPDKLVLGENKAELEAGDNYFYTWTAEEDGELTLAIDTEQSPSWYYTYNIDCANGEYTYGDYAFSDMADSPTSMTFAVAKGDTVIVEVTSNGEAGAVVLNASFAAAVSEPCVDGHTYGDWIVDIPATCTEDGMKHRVCEACGNVEEETDWASWHSYQWSVTEPTCTEAGYITYTCSRCGDSYVRDYIDPNAKLFQSALYMLGESGVYDFTAGYFVSVARDLFWDLLPEGEDFGYVTVSAEKFEAVMNTRFVLTDEMVQAILSYGDTVIYDEELNTYSIHIGGGFGGWMDERAYMGYVDNDGVYDVYFAHVTYDFLCDHLPEGVDEWEYAEELGYPATIEYDGIVYTSGPDGYYIIVSYDNYGRKITVEINDDDTVRILTCEDYTDLELTEFDDKTGEAAHEFVWIETEPTCTEYGRKNLTCVHCGAIEAVDLYAPPNGHSWDEGVITLEPTEMNEGELLCTCTVCGETETQSIPKLEHTEHKYKEEVFEPTCNEVGYIVYTCEVCGDSYVEDFAVPTRQHDYDDEGVCMNCGWLSLDHRFVDTPANAWYYSYVDFVVERGIMSGVGGDVFSPTTNITRASVAVMLWNLAGQPEYSVTENPFNDVPETWYTKAVLWAYEKGIVAGNGAGGFNPNNNVTRQEITVMLYKYAQAMGCELTAVKDVELSSFADGDTVASWASPYIKWAVDLGLISGRTNGGLNYLAPTGTASRAELAVIFTNFVKLVENN